MNAIGKLGTVLWIVAATGIAACVAFLSHQSREIESQNAELRHRLMQRDTLAAENRRLSNLLSETNLVTTPLNPSAGADTSPAPAPASDELKNELVRLRGELEAFRSQNKKIETLRADTRQARASAASGSRNANLSATGNRTSPGNESQIEILTANYGTDKTNVDVADALRERVRGDSLKAIASNNLNGDPEFGTVKHLTVVYRIGGVTVTNNFNEGDLVILPPPPPLENQSP